MLKILKQKQLTYDYSLKVGQDKLLVMQRE